MNDNDVWTRMMMDFLESRAGRDLLEMTEEQKKFKEVNKCDFVKVIGDK